MICGMAMPDLKRFLLRRHLLWPLAAALHIVASLALAQTTAVTSAPQKQLPQERFTLVAPFPPGGPVDLLSRLLADGLAQRYGQVAVVENLAGAAGHLGMDRVKRSKPDGHTLLVVPAGNLTINPTLMPNFPFDIEHDFVPVTQLAKAPNVLVATPQAKLRNLADLLAQARRQPDSLSYASPGVGSGLHLAGELFKSQTHTEILHVPYKGTGPALNDVLAGVVPLMFSNLPATLPFIRNGKLVALGVTDSVRSPVAPDIPTIAEQGVAGVVVTSWYGLLAPAGTPTPMVEQLARDANDILSQPGILEKLQAQGLQPVSMRPNEFTAHLRRETADWARIIRSRHITAE
jgi:tripartite-type tricarboxylate transporter receptor subunit TctC